MAKILLCTSMLMIISMKKSSWWVIQTWMFIIATLYMFFTPLSMFHQNISHSYASDPLTFNLTLLTIWICSLMMLASTNVLFFKNFNKLFNLTILILMLILMSTFNTTNMFNFYLFFEASLIPTLIIILGWGYQPERIQAGTYLMFYTIIASMPLLVTIFFLYNKTKTLSMVTSNLQTSYNITYTIMYLSLLTAFLVKMPMFLTHLWLPKAHVEAPIAGSMILAGVLLKLGGYGIMRMIKFSIIIANKINILWINLSLIGSLIISLVCLRQTDLKKLIAYSSVSHMGLTITGMMTLTSWGMNGSMSMMIAHGLASSGLFCLANIIYERSSSRSLLMNRGLMNIMPSMTLWWFLLSASNMAAPPSLNLMAEITILNTLLNWSMLSMLTLIIISFLSAAYTLYLYSYTQHGSPLINLYSSSNNNAREHLTLMLHWLPLNMMILKGDTWLLWT
uniref:NADH dehydrogenase subunit 4 n=1 Tax=Haplodiplatys aotouensis TaxID=2962943 RepID=UPI002114E9FB|nr:NADH dehydrogenase subunit 4 [Haplodiplatys aotouensis]UTI38885.1 NADH dehydrogenase subunit 4 [Haplodiplatys aotouensis]UTI38898.1 NADH dehydrogenase subunit 4 [Haplodiplatys aotouensis]